MEATATQQGAGKCNTCRMPRGEGWAFMGCPECAPGNRRAPAKASAVSASPRGFGSGEATRAFALAGKARFTLESRKTGVHFTYQVDAGNAEGSIHHVAVLTGPSNETDYQYLGTLFPRVGRAPEFMHGTKSRIGRDAPSAKAFAWAWRHIARGELPPECEVHHGGRCGVCRRALTVPESVTRGIGPECAARMGSRSS